VAKFKPPAEDFLLDLAGGNIDMAMVPGEVGVELRTVLAYRALHIKKKIVARAEKQGNFSPKKKTFWKRNVAVIWEEDYESSDEEDEDERLKREHKEKKEKRKEDRRLRALEDIRLEKRRKELAALRKL